MPEFLSFQEIVIEAADDLGCHLALTTTADSSGTGTIVTIAALQDQTVDDSKFRHQYLAVDSNLDEWRLIISNTASTDGVVTVSRGFTTPTDVDNAKPVHIFKVLSPTEWMLAANNGLRDKYLKARFYIPFDDQVDEYNLTIAAPWMKSSEQILRIRIRDERDNRVTEAEMPVRYIYDNEGSVVMQIPKVYAAVGMGILIEARRYYDKIDAWADQVLMTHSKLIRAAVKHEALKLIFATLGQQARGYFGQQMLLTERELVEQEARFQSTTVKRDWATEEVRSTGDRQALAGWRW